MSRESILIITKAVRNSYVKKLHIGHADHTAGTIEQEVYSLNPLGKIFLS